MKISDHQYADEFTDEMTLLLFCEWLSRNLVSFANNIVKYKSKPMPLYEWISWFLDWSEYSDFMEWKDECEKNEDTTTV